MFDRFMATFRSIDNPFNELKVKKIRVVLTMTTLAKSKPKTIKKHSLSNLKYLMPIITNLLLHLRSMRVFELSLLYPIWGLVN